MSIKTNTTKEVPVKVFWDSGATINLITFTAAEALGLIGNKVQITETKVGGKQESMTSKNYLLPLTDVGGKIVEFKVYAIDQILTKVQSFTYLQIYTKKKHSKQMGK